MLAALSFPPGAHWAEGGALGADFALSSPEVGFPSSSADRRVLMQET